jgi:hypothetical protein
MGCGAARQPRTAVTPRSAGARAAVLLAAILAGAARPAFSQTSPYADAATAALVNRARQRHLHQDSLVRDYRALVRTRFDASAGKSRFARMMPLIAHESVARVTWRAPNDLKVEMLGARTKSQLSRFLPGDAEAKDENVRVSFGDRPWFVPRALGDSVRLLGVPETAALHPLAPGAEAYYNYAIVDSVTMYLPNHTLRAIAIRVRPRRVGPSLVAGDMWVDAETADVVRLMVTFLGEYLWDAPDSDATAKDSADARNDSRRAQEILTVQADLEYSLLEDRYWMPYRQVLDITAEVNFLIRLAAPFRVITTFSDYRVNEDMPIAFEVPIDSLNGRRTSRRYCPRCGEDERERRADDVGYLRTGTWSGGRWEMVVPPADSLFAYPWTDTLRLEEDDATAEHIRQSVAELARIHENLPADLLMRRPFGVAWGDVADLVRFNRVQGASVGLGVKLRPRLPFTTVFLSGRYGFSDQRVTGSALLRRDAPGGLLEVRGFRDVVEAEPWTQGQGIGNAMNALFAAHDDADYYLATGGAVAFTPFGGSFANVDFRIGVEHHGSMDAEATSGLNDVLGGSGLFPPNPSVAGGNYVRASIRPTAHVGWSTITFGVEGLASDSLIGGRGWVTAQVPFRVVRHTGTLTLRTGYAVGDSIPQLQFRAGGPWTVRGYDYGVRRGAGAWSAQLDLALLQRWIWAPVVFADVGDVYRAGPFDPLVGLGGGVSFLGGLIRFNGSWGVNPETGFRFDLLFRAPR